MRCDGKEWTAKLYDDGGDGFCRTGQRRQLATDQPKLKFVQEVKTLTVRVCAVLFVYICVCRASAVVNRDADMDVLHCHACSTESACASRSSTPTCRLHCTGDAGKIIGSLYASCTCNCVTTIVVFQCGLFARSAGDWGESQYDASTVTS